MRQLKKLEALGFANSRQNIVFFFKAMNDNKEVLEIVDGEFVVKKKQRKK